MKRYKINWTEKHSAIVDGACEDDAIDNAYWKHSDETVDCQELESIEEIGPDDMDVAKEA